MVTAIRLLGPLAAVLMLAAAMVVSYTPRPVRHPSKLEKTCPFAGAWMPCHIRDEALQQTWDI